jgi:hypothetical protein
MRIRCIGVAGRKRVIEVSLCANEDANEVEIEKYARYICRVESVEMVRRGLRHIGCSVLVYRLVPENASTGRRKPSPCLIISCYDGESMLRS